jgi:putative DNA primase/helicase
MNVNERQLQLNTIVSKYFSADATKKKEKSAKAAAKTESAGRDNFQAKQSCLDAMFSATKNMEDTNDGSSRMVAMVFRIVGHNLTDEAGIEVFREVEQERPFNREYDDARLLQEIRRAEEKIERGSEVVIRTGPDVYRIATEAINTLARIGIYQKGNLLARIEHDPPKLQFAKHDNGAPRIAFLPSGSMVDTLSQAGVYEKYDGRAGKWRRCPPPTEIGVAVANRHHYPTIPQIAEVVARPVLHPNGEIVATPGYDSQTGIYLNTEGDWPSVMETKAAIKLLLDVFSDFPFSGEDDFYTNPFRASCLAALLTLLCRNVIVGPTPLHSCDGNRPGCGKGLMMDVCTTIAEGREATKYPQTDSAEMRKAILAAAIAGQPYMLFDNLSQRFGGPVIEAAITTSSINDRILGQSQVVDLPLRITWLATANNVTFTPDMLRRVCPIKMDADEKPELRTDFKYPNLLGYVRANRRELLIAGLSVVSNYLKAGIPDQKLTGWGSFDQDEFSWNKVVRSALVWSGVADPAEAREYLYGSSDDSTQGDTEKLMSAWTFEKPMSVKEALAAARANEVGYPVLSNLLSMKTGDHTDAEFLGKLLRNAKGVRVEGRCFMHDGKSAYPKWQITSAD